MILPNSDDDPVMSLLTMLLLVLFAADDDDDDDTYRLPCSTDTVFEFVTNALGSQAAVLAGGRYDTLFTQFGAKTKIPVRELYSSVILFFIVVVFAVAVDAVAVAADRHSYDLVKKTL